MNFETITVQDCKEYYLFKGMHVILENGQVIGFAKED